MCIFFHEHISCTESVSESVYKKYICVSIFTTFMYCILSNFMYVYIYIYMNLLYATNNVKLCEYCMLFYRDYFDVCTTHDTPSQWKSISETLCYKQIGVAHYLSPKIDTSMPETREFFPH